MSRVGKLPISLNPDIEAEVSSDNEVFVKKQGKVLKVSVHPEIEVQVKNSVLTLKRKNDDQKTKAFQGLYRALIQNAVTGLSKGWSKSLQLGGVGYKALVSGKKLEMHLGYSRPVFLNIPEGIEIRVEKQNKVHISGADRQQVGQISAQIRSLRPPEPYLGKGIKYVGEVIRKKAGKSGAEKKQ